MVWDLLLKADPEGPTLIIIVACTHRMSDHIDPPFRVLLQHTVIRVEALLVLFGAAIFAIYSVLTRLVAKHDRPETSVAYVALIGFVALSLVVPFFWKPLPPQDWGWMALLCVFGSMAHGLLIKVYQLAEANVVQPLAYLQLAFATGYGVVLFGETPDLWTWIGMTILVLSGAWAARTGQ